MMTRVRLLQVGGQHQRSATVDGGGSAPAWERGRGEAVVFEADDVW